VATKKGFGGCWEAIHSKTNPIQGQSLYAHHPSHQSAQHTACP
jgi:hypothetical protein